MNIFKPKFIKEDDMDEFCYYFNDIGKFHVNNFGDLYILFDLEIYESVGGDFILIKDNNYEDF